MRLPQIDLDAIALHCRPMECGPIPVLCYYIAYPDEGQPFRAERNSE